MTTEILKNHILNLKIANREGETMSYDAVVNTITNEELLKSFSASVDVANLAIIKNFKLASLAKTTNLKGFRLGKAPLSVVWNQHQGELTKEIVNDTINDVTQEIVNVVESTLIMSPQINLKHFSFEKGLEFEASLNLLPQVDLPEVTDVTLEKFTYEIEPKDIQERVQELMTRNKKFVKAENTHKAANGDKVVIDFEGKIDGVAFPGGTAKKTLLELGSKSFIDNFEDQLLKHKVGDHVDVKVTFPQDYHQKDFAGKKAEFAVDIHEIQQAVAYENEEDFSKAVGFSSIEEMHNRVKESLNRECAEKNKIQMKIALFDQLDKKCKFALPQIMIDQEFEQLWKNVQVLIERKEINKPEAELKEEYLKLATRRVKLGILLSQMAGKLDVIIEQNDIVEAVRAQAMSNPVAAQAIIKYYTENKEAIDSLKGPILEEKVVEKLFNQVKITEKSIEVKKLLQLTAA